MLIQLQDAERLPEGFERIGYDADEQTYTFSGPDGRTYVSEPGCRYGKLWPADEPRPRRTVEEIEAQTDLVKKSSRDSARAMLPFALLIFVFLLLVFKLVNRPDSNDGAHQVINCAEGSHDVHIHKDETCWSIAEKYRMGVEDLLEIGGNKDVDCKALKVGQSICVPDTLV